VKEVSLEIEINRLAQIVAEDKFSKKNVHQMVREDIATSMPVKKLFTACCKTVRDYMDKMYYASKNGRIAHIQYVDPEEIVLELFSVVMINTGSVSIQKIVGAFAPWFEYEDLLDGVKTAAEILGCCSKTGLYGLIDSQDSEDGYINIESHWRLDKTTTDFIARTRYLDPMIVQPEEWSNNKNGGYITTKNSVVLGKNKHHDGDQALDVLNILQKIDWSLDPRILNIEEESKKPLNTFEKKKAFTLMTSISKQVYKEMLQQGNHFFLAWKMDFRGRVYSDGYYINLQSNSYRKAMLEFTKKQLIEG